LKSQHQGASFTIEVIKSLCGHGSTGAAPKAKRIIEAFFRNNHRTEIDLNNG
jgi:hypothetical protein